MSCRAASSSASTTGHSSSRAIRPLDRPLSFPSAPALAADASFTLVRPMTLGFRSTALAPFAASLLLPLAAAAQETARDTARVAPVVVTATRSPVAADREPSSVTVVSGGQLRAEGITTAGDARRAVPGLSLVQTGSYGGATSLFIRG